jgi:hypothetical protein
MLEDRSVIPAIIEKRKALSPQHALLVGISGIDGFTMGQTQSSQGQGGVPARFVPVLDKQGHRETIDYHGHRKGFPWQLVDSKGRPFKGWDLTNFEKVLKQQANTKVQITPWTGLSSQGILTDVVGPGRKLGPETNYTRETTIGNTVYWNGFPFPISTQFRQEIVVQHGQVIRIWETPIEPGEPGYVH